MGPPAQVSERIVLAQKAYILFYMRAAPRPASALTLHSRPPFSPRASASSPRAGAQQGPGDKDLAGAPASAAGAAVAEPPARGAKLAAGTLTLPAAPQGLGGKGAQQRAVPASPFAAGHVADAGAAPAAQPAAPAVAAAGSAGAGLAAKRSAPAAEPGAARPKKRMRVLASMRALPTGLAAAQVGMLQPKHGISKCVITLCV